MVWLYSLGLVLGGLIILWILFNLLLNSLNHKKLQKDPDKYCYWLFKQVENGSSKEKAKALQNLFKLAAGGVKPAVKQLWNLLDNFTIPAIVPHLKEFLRENDQSTWKRREAAEKRREQNRPEKELNDALKLLAKHDPLEKNKDNIEGWGIWRGVENEIREISKRRPFPQERQLRLDYIGVIDSFRLSNRGMFQSDSTFGGGTHEQIRQKREAYKCEMEELERRIHNDYKKALTMASTGDEKAVEAYREKTSKYPFTVFL